MASDILVKVGADISDFSRKMAQSNKALSNFRRANQQTFDAFRQTGNALTKWVTAPALAAITALTGITLVKGFGRLVGIDTARAKLEALGHDAKSVESIMTSALDSVKGTSFGLDEAATTAANAVAAGVAPGKELTRYLTLTADAAAIAGAGLGEMGAIMNKVKTSNKAYNSELQMLSDRGLPIYQWLADEAGTTADAIFDMASQGKISSEMLLDAIEANIGGAAKVMGEKSFAAALKNIGADIARIGASFLDAGGKAGGFFSTVKPLLTEFREFLGSLEGSAADLGAKFGEAFIKIVETLRTLKSWFDALSPSVQKIISVVAALGSIFAVASGPILRLIGFIPNIIAGFTAVKTVFLALTGPIGLTIAAIVGIVTAVVVAYNKFEWFRDAVNNVWQAIVSVIMAAVGGIVIFVKDIAAQITEFWTENGEQIKQASQNVWNFIKNIIETVMPIIEGIIKAVWTVIQIVVMAVWENIKGVISGALDIILGLVKTFSSLFTGDWKGVWEGVKRIFSGAIELLWNAVQLLLWGRLIKGVVSFAKLFGSHIASLWNVVRTIFTNSINAIRTFFTNGFNMMRNLANANMVGMRTIITTVWNAIRSVFKTVISTVLNTVRSGFSNVVNAIRTAMTNASNSVRNILSGMVNAVRSGVTKFFNAGKDLVRGLINGIKNMTASAVAAITGVVNGVVNKAKSLLKISSPSRLFEQIGRWTGEGLADGIKKTTGIVKRSSEMLAEAATPDAPAISLAYDTPAGVRSSLASAVSGTVDVRGREDMIAMAIGRLERRLTNLEVVMDARVVGRIVEPHVTESQERNKKIHSNFRG